MKFTELNIQTQRQFPNNARASGFRWLVRAGYLTRENELMPLGKQAIARLKELANEPDFLTQISLPILSSDSELFFPLTAGHIEIIHCKSCKYTERAERAIYQKSPLTGEEPLPLVKVPTPDCNTIEALANFLKIPKEKTAKALMYTRVSDNEFIFVVIRGDMQLSEAKLTNITGEVRAATEVEISAAAAVAGYASPIGLKNVTIIVDELIPHSQNLAAGANEKGRHFKNSNYGRDYIANKVADLTLAEAGDPCANCGKQLSSLFAINLTEGSAYNLYNLLLALAETYHDEKGLMFPATFAAYDVYLMHVPGKKIDTLSRAQNIYTALQNAGISVLFDNRNERAGVKFNDADIIGCPFRITVGERALQNNSVEIKRRTDSESEIIGMDSIQDKIKATIIS